MSQGEDKGLFDRLGEILNTPLPGTQPPPAVPSAGGSDQGDPSLLERIRDILNTPLPGTQPAGQAAPAPVETQAPAVQGGAWIGTAQAQPAPVEPQAQAQTQGAPPAAPTPELDADDLDEDWWRQDWVGFRSHQDQDRGGMDMKQRGDLEKFAAYQAQERQRFDAFQQQEAAMFRQQQAWRLNAWRQAVAAMPGQRPPPPPWPQPGGMPPPGPIGSPMPGRMEAPHWMRPPRGR